MRIKYAPIVSNIIQTINDIRFQQEDHKKQQALSNTGNTIAILAEEALCECHADHFLYFGNLLGIVRDGKFIEYDDDVDYGIIITESFSWDRFEDCMTRHNLKKIRQFSFDGKITEQTYAYQGLTVDFFGCFIHDHTMISYLYYRKDRYIYNSKYEFHVGRFDYVRVTGTRAIEYTGKTYQIPTNAEELLESIYSENWRVPDKHWDHKKWKNFHELPLLGKCEYF